MCISSISNNIYPFDGSPHSILRSASLITALASTILALAAISLKCGALTITLSSASCFLLWSSFLIPLCRRPHYLPTSHSYSEYPSIEKQVKKTNHKLYEKLKQNDFEAFKNVLARDQKLNARSLFEGNVFLDEGDKTIALPDGLCNSTVGYSIFELTILLKKDKEGYLEAILNTIPSHTLDLSEEYLKQLLEITSENCIRLVLEKLNPSANLSLLALAWEDADQFSAWIKQFLMARKKDLVLKKLCTGDVLIERIVASNLKNKLSWIPLLRKLDVKDLVINREVVVHPYPILQKHQCSLLDLAIDYQDLELIQALPLHALANKPACWDEGVYPPLHRALIVGNFEVVKILLEAGADKEAPLKDGVGLLFSITGERTEEWTPFMLTKALNREDFLAFFREL